MSTTAYASDGGSSTESEDELLYQQVNVKSEPSIDSGAEPSTETKPVVKSESHAQLEIKPEPPVEDSIPTATPPCCSACGYALLVVPQKELVSAESMLECKCCLLVLPDSSYSKKQRSEGRKDVRKCKACTGNAVKGAQPLVKPTRQKPQVPQRLRSTKSEKRRQDASAVFVNKVGRLKMAKGALQRKRDEASKLKMTKRRQEYEQQLDKEEKELTRQSALLERENPSAFKNLMSDLKIKKPPTYEQDRKEKKAKKAKAKKRKAETEGTQAKKKKKGPAVDSSVYVPPASAVEEVPAREIPTRSRARTQQQTETVQEKAVVKMEQPKVEPKTE